MSLPLRGAGFAALIIILASRVQAFPVDLELYSDLRLTHASGEQSWLDGGFGKTRYGGGENDKSQTKLRISEISLIAKTDISWNVKAFAHIKYDPEQNKPVDIVEAYITYAPAPKSEFSFALKAGLFFPHISRENVGIAWTSLYTITPSAVNSWVGEEVRSLGLEAKVTYKKDLHKVDFTAALIGNNDPAATLLAFRGWALGGIKTGAFSRLPLPLLPYIGLGGTFLDQPHYVRPIREIDSKPGYYLALDYAYNNWLKIGAFYSDSRGDPEQITAFQYSWDTRFWNFYAEADVGADIKLIAQHMTGRTEMGFLDPTEGRRNLDVDFDAGYVLATKVFDRYRLSARYDWFSTHDNSFLIIDNNNEDGTAITLAFATKLAKKSTVILEYLHVKSDRLARNNLGFAENQSNDLLQISFRQRF